MLTPQTKKGKADGNVYCSFGPGIPGDLSKPGWKAVIMETFSVVTVLMFLVVSWVGARVAVILWKYTPRPSPSRRPYRKPHASYVSPGVVSVFGDVEYLLNNFYMVAQAERISHMGNGHWEIHLRDCDKEVTRYVVDAINQSFDV